MERAPDYQPFYCEENVWRLCQDARVQASERLVAVIIGAGLHDGERRCLFFHQRCAGSPQRPVLWDFHVVLFVRAQEWLAWDLDSDLGAPLPAAAYLPATFGDQPAIPPPLRPLLRLISAESYVAGLRSDRSHMRDRHGRWLKPPPPWPPPGGGQEHNVLRLLDPGDDFLGPLVDLAGLRERLGLTPGR